MAEGRTEMVGQDVVRLYDSALVVDSAADMPDWDFRDYRRTAVLFRDQMYFVAEKRLLPGGSYRYVLEPWVDGVDVPGRTITYNEGLLLPGRVHHDGRVRAPARCVAGLAHGPRRRRLCRHDHAQGPAEGGEQEQPGFWEWALPGWKRRAQSR